MSKVVVISGYFNPIHVGHLDYIESAKKLGDYLIVIVNNDSQVDLKGSVPFMNENDRLRIVSSIKGVDRAVVSEDCGRSVVTTLKRIYDTYINDPFFVSMTFFNGGDRTEGNSPEEDFCKQFGINTAYGVGGSKSRSSSDLINSANIS